MTDRKDIRKQAAILKTLPLVPEVFSLTGTDVGKRNKIMCPFHDDTDPSLSIFSDGTRWKCHGCGKGGTAVTLVMEWYGCDYDEAVVRLYKGLHDPQWTLERLEVWLKGRQSNEQTHTKKVCQMLWDALVDREYRHRTRGVHGRDVSEPLLSEADDWLDVAVQADGCAPSGAYLHLSHLMDHHKPYPVPRDGQAPD